MFISHIKFTRIYYKVRVYVIIHFSLFADNHVNVSPTWEGLLFNLNLVQNLTYLLGSVIVFCFFFLPLLRHWSSHSDDKEWFNYKQ